MPNYTREDLKEKLATRISGTIDDTELNTIINDAVGEVVAEADIKSMKRRAYLAPNLFDDIFDYECPVDCKSIIDLQPQIKRGRLDQWRLTTPEEFDRMKEDTRIDRYGDPIRINRSQWLGDSIICIDTRDSISRVRASRPVEDKSITISELDAVGDWTVYGDATNLTKDSDNFVKGSAALNFDINAYSVQEAGIENINLDAFDISEYTGDGSIFVWVYLSNAEDVSGMTLLVGSDSSNYYIILASYNNEGVSMQAGWNLMRFDMVDALENGTVVDASCTYVRLAINCSDDKTGQTDFRFDWLVMKKGDKYYLNYYSLYAWQTEEGEWLEESEDDSDFINVDVTELRLIEYKCTELGERHLRSGKADSALSLYQAYLLKYQQDNPSEALLLSTTYQFTDN
jgi:hypothetical protein